MPTKIPRQIEDAVERVGTRWPPLSVPGANLFQAVYTTTCVEITAVPLAQDINMQSLVCMNS